MSLVKALFGKELLQLQRTDLEDFFSIPQSETEVLEFKSGKTKEVDVFKRVAGFLNTNGGVLILGAPEDKKVSRDSDERQCTGALTPVENFASQERLMRQIATNITPAPSTVRATTIPLDGRGFALVLEIERSLHPPHMVNQIGYYFRFDTETKMAPHGLVEALFHKRQTPNLRASTYFMHTMGKDLGMTIAIHNDSLATAFHVGCRFTFDGVRHMVRTRDEGVLTLLDEQADYENFNMNGIIVKGLIRELQFGFSPIYGKCLLTLLYFCQDTEVKTHAFLIDSNGIVEEEVISNGPYDLEKIYELKRAYLQYKKEAILEILPSGVRVMDNDEEIRPLRDAVARNHGIMLTTGVLDFYCTMDGFKAKGNGLPVTFFRFSNFVTTIEDIGGRKYATLGTYNNWVIYYALFDNHGIFMAPAFNRNKIKFITHVFYDLLIALADGTINEIVLGFR